MAQGPPLSSTCAVDQGLIHQPAGVLAEALQLAALLAHQLHLALAAGVAALEVDHLLGAEPLPQRTIQLRAGAHRPEEGVGVLLALLAQLLDPLLEVLAAIHPLHLHRHIAFHHFAAAEVQGRLEALHPIAQAGAGATGSQFWRRASCSRLWRSWADGACWLRTCSQSSSSGLGMRY